MNYVEYNEKKFLTREKTLKPKEYVLNGEDF